jgi:bacillolysin
MKVLKISLLWFCITITNSIFGQKTGRMLPFDPQNKIIKTTAGGVLKFNESTKITAKQIASNPSSYLGINKNYSFLQKRKENTNNSIEHERFTQHFKGIEVQGGELILHSKNGFVTEANHELYQLENDLPTKASISPHQAINVALAKHNAQEYYWQNSYRESRAKAKGKSYYPAPTLCFLPDSIGVQLCYRMYVYSTRPHKAFQYFVNASNGAIQASKNMEMACFDTNKNPKKEGITVPKYLKKLEPVASNIFAIINCFNMSVTTPFDGLQIVKGQYDTETSYPYLPINACNNAVNTIMTTDGYIYKFGSNNWNVASNGFSSFISQGVGLISFGMEKTANYFSTHFGRAGHGPNANGVDIDVHFPHDFNNNEGNPNPYNASYSYDPLGNDDIYVGQGAGEFNYDVFASPDVMGHEYQHGVDAYRASLNYEGESGALDESFADIFGEAVERYIRGTNDFKIMNEVRINGGMRNMISPTNPGNTLYTNSTGANQPDRYNGSYWKNTANTSDDNGGVHRNSGVQNHMFYMLVSGGSGFTNSATAHGTPYNNPGYTYSIAGIGWDKAINIAYHAQNYLTSGSSYAQARNAWVQAAVALYGACSFEAIQTGLAWHAVGLNPPGINYEQICTNMLLANSIPYVLGTAQATLSSSTYMDVAGNICAASVNGGQLLTLNANTDVLIQPGFDAPEGSNVQVDVNFNQCMFASY